jgi:hypothetical protein
MCGLAFLVMYSGFSWVLKHIGCANSKEFLCKAPINCLLRVVAHLKDAGIATIVWIRLG